MGISTTVQAQGNDKSALIGRWNITVTGEGSSYPSWLEVKHSGIKTLVGHYVGHNGSARPVSEILFNNGSFEFSLPPQWEEGNYLQVQGKIENGKISGTLVTPEGKKHNWTGVKAPALRPEKTPVWGEPIKLFNGKDMTGWKATGKNQWVVENGILKSPASGSNIYTDKKFNDFKLHIEFRYPEGSNSGVYLRGRYEVQIMDTKNTEPSNVEFGGVYGFLTPSEMAAKKPGEWQTFEITLTGRMVTIVANGKTIICNQAIPGITGGALDSNEGEPGPILIQGDHGAVEYRSIVLTPAL